VSRLDAELQALDRRGVGPLYLPLYHATDSVGRIRDWLFAGRDVRNVVPLLDSLRLVKDEAELARLRKAIAITTDALRAGMQATRPGMYEYQLEATIEYHFRNAGADRVGFPSIVGSGPNATTFHYDVSRRQMQEGELVVADVGAEWGQYSADVTRTFPVNGRFTARQKALYDLVLATQQAVLDSVRPGMTIRALTRIARETMRVRGGSLCGEQTCDTYFGHGLSHWLGLRVHDVGDYATPLAPGMVLTIEPGVYLPAESLGVRIEDDVLVTERGHELLSGGAPRSTAEIEAAMRPRRQAER
jgi:Xaa-Pro aminopeptidase